jgi:hypothetical protein
MLNADSERMEIGRQDVGYRVAYGDERRRRIGRRSGRNTSII